MTDINAHLYDAVNALDRAEGRHLWSQARPHYRESIAAMRRLMDSLDGQPDVQVNGPCLRSLVGHLLYQIAELEAAPVAGVAVDAQNEPEPEHDDA